MKDKILGTLYGQAIGDAMGMPSELWPRKKIQEYFGYITQFLEGPSSNNVAKNFKKGQFTDDTAQALVILDSLFENGFEPNEKLLADNLITWGRKNHAFEEEIFGPSSKAALLAISHSKSVSEVTDKAETNGSAMRISPVGLLFVTMQIKELVEYVRRISVVTHSSDVAIAGAATIAAAVCAAKENFEWDDILQYCYQAHDIGLEMGAATFSASIKARIKTGVKLAKKFKDDDEQFLQAVYDSIGSGVLLSESVPAAVTIAYYSREVEKCAILCANLGGDTDTIGAMATAICGAKDGYKKIPQELIVQIDQSNDYNIKEYAQVIYEYVSRKESSQ